MEPIFYHCKHYISDDQHGFMPKRSTSTNLLSFTTYVTDGLANGTQTDAIYTDLSAAFDKINHDIAVAKLERLGFSGSLLKWLHSYLVDRQLNVNIGNSISATFRATSGIPQGSHLGPLIFLLYFNDVNFTLKGPRLSYADDMKIFSHISSINDSLVLQQQLDLFVEWCSTNRMKLNPAKCSVISFSRKKTTIKFDYTLSGITIPRQSCVKDLGVFLDEMLNFKPHVSYIVSKASRQLGFIFRLTKNFKDIYCLKSLYCSLVRTNLEYCSAIWSPHYQNGVERIESIQRRFIRFALRRLPWRDPLRLPSYESRCQLIAIDTLQVRRVVARALLVSDFLTARIDCAAILEQISLHVHPRVLRNGSFLRVPFRRSNYTANGAINGLQRSFNRVSTAFDFNLSRDALRKSFTSLVRNISY